VDRAAVVQHAVDGEVTRVHRGVRILARAAAEVDDAVPAFGVRAAKWLSAISRQLGSSRSGKSMDALADR